MPSPKAWSTRCQLQLHGAHRLCPLAAGSLGKVLTAQLAGEGQPRTLGTPAFGLDKLRRRHVIALEPKGFRQESQSFSPLLNSVEHWF